MEETIHYACDGITTIQMYAQGKATAGKELTWV